MRAMSDRELLEQAKAGDEDAFERLVEPHRGALYAHAAKAFARFGLPEELTTESV
jgi:DNA-directed RNA polymerase specialized sigma24 family protein